MNAAERMLAGVLRRLPDRCVEALPGADSTLRGSALDPRLAVIAHAARRKLPFHRKAPGAARRELSRAMSLLGGRPLPMAHLERCSIPGAAQPLRARVYHPPGVDGPRPLVLYFHQGGFVIGDLDWCEPFCTRLAATARCPVLSVAYRLAPEHPFPAAFEDATAAFRWATRNAGEVGGDPTRLVVAGDSAGGSLAAHVAREARDTGEVAPVFQLLIYPWLELGENASAYAPEFQDSWPLDPDGVRWFRRHLLPESHDARDPRLSPPSADELEGLAPAHVVTAGFDPLCDEGSRHAKRLSDAGVPVSHRHYASLCHSFSGMGGASPAVGRALADIALVLERALTRPADVRARPR